MVRRPIRQLNILRPITWLISFPVVWRHRLKINRRGMDGIKPPFLLLCTHHAFIDFMVTTAALFPHRANYVVAIDGFIGREWLLRLVGGICKRKFTNDLRLVRQIRHVLSRGDVLALYPEARYSHVGVTALLPNSLGKMAKLANVPVVMLNMHGNYLNSPVWNLKSRGVPLEADYSLLFTAEELKATPLDEVNRIIREAFEYDEYRWQREKGIKITYPKRAEGLHKPLYQCAHCHTEGQMYSHLTILGCRACNKQWEMDELGSLQAVRAADDETALITEFSHIPHWYEFQRQQVQTEVEERRYSIHIPVNVEALPNARGYIPLGAATLTHSLDGFRLEAIFEDEPFLLTKPPLSMDSCHIEYDYFKKGDCIDLSTLEDTYYIYPTAAEVSVTKIALATEEIFHYHRRRENVPQPSA
jgi:1-acyl-sn-glycerol-3-phosphate acyltransferase